MHGPISLHVKQGLVASPKTTKLEPTEHRGLSAFSLGKDEKVKKHAPNVIDYHQHFEDAASKEYYDNQLVIQKPIQHLSPIQTDSIRGSNHSELTIFK